MLAIFSVSNLNDAGAGSLRQAISDSDSNGPLLDTIVFDDLSGIVELASELPDITGAIEITGPGAETLTIDANSTGRVFDIDATGDLTISGLTITGGSVAGAGAGIRNLAGSLTIQSSVVTGNNTIGQSGFGAGIYSTGSLVIENSTLSGNVASRNGGGLLAPAGDILISHSAVFGNQAPGPTGVGGGLFFSELVTATIENSQVTSNFSTSAGAGLAARGGMDTPRVTIQGSIIAGNEGAKDIDVLQTLPSPYRSLGNNLVGTGPPTGQSENVPNAFVAPGDVTQVSVIEVTSASDPSAGGTTLREAITLANSTPTIDDVIVFDREVFGLPQTIDLVSQLPTITDSVSIIGPGQTLLTLDAGDGTDNTFATGDGFRHFQIDDGNDSQQLEALLSGMTLAGGDAAKGTDAIDNGTGNGGDGESGGAILSRENLTVQNSNLSGNSAGDGGDADFIPYIGFIGTGGTGGSGGGIASELGNLSISGSKISGNRSGLRGGGAYPIDYSGFGGGVFSGNGNLIVSNSSFTNNNSSLGEFERLRLGGGGALANSLGQLSVNRSTFEENTAVVGGAIDNLGDATIEASSFLLNFAVGSDGSGGAISNRNTFQSTASVSVTTSSFEGNQSGEDGGAIWNSGSATIQSSTLSDNNRAEDDGGAIALRFGGSLDLLASTISGNTAGDNGGGIDNNASSVVINIVGSTITANQASGDGDGIRSSAGTLNINSSIVALNDGLLGSNLFGSISTNEHNLLSSDPLLGPLAHNGGPTKTHALLPGSPAINAGDPNIASGVDQRGNGFSRVQLGRTDIGAFEFQATLPAQGLVVSTDTDVIDGDFSAGELSLREAIAIANDLPGGNVITFSALFDSQQTIDLSLGELAITDTVTITGPGADLLTIDAGGNSRAIRIAAGISKSTIQGLHLTGGDTDTDGGAILARSDLDLFDSRLSNSFAGDDGGGLRAEDGADVLINRTLFDGNTATDDGGGVQAGGNAAVTIVNSTVSGNNAADGGGIRAGTSATINVRNSTIANNIAARSGGIDADGPMILTSTIVANNTATVEFTQDIGGSRINVFDSHHNLIGDAGSTGGLSDGTNDNIVGNSGVGLLDPRLGPLADNGGPTLTHALLAGSPAFDAGNPDQLANFARSGVATQSSDHGSGNFPASNALDGDLTTFTHTESNTPDASWQVDLLADQEIAQIVLYNRLGLESRLRDITVEILDADDSPLFTSELLNPNNVLNGPDKIVLDLALPIVGRKVKVSRLTVGDSPDGRILSLGEVEVFAVDQRGLPRVVGASIDIGAFEAVPLVVNDTGDFDDGDIYNNVMTLREAINQANRIVGEEEITFSSLFDTPQTIMISSQLPTITDDLLINGPGANLLAIDAGNGTDGIFGTGDGYRLFTINDEDSSHEIEVTLSGVTLTGGDVGSGGDGGAIFNTENFTLFSSTLSNNFASDRGGGIFGGGAIINSTISGNRAESGGAVGTYAASFSLTDSGGIENSSLLSASVSHQEVPFFCTSSFCIVSSTISGNSATENGGGIFTGGTGFTQVDVQNSTITANSAQNGGGVSSNNRVFLRSSIVAGNSATNSNPDFDGTPIIGSTSNIIPNDSNSTAGWLGPLADNGGPTKTHALLPVNNSPAIDAGAFFTIPIPGLFDTGVDSSRVPIDANVGDSNYQLVSHPGTGSLTDFVLRNQDLPEPWIDNSSRSSWIGVASSTIGPAGNYIYRTTFDLSGYDLSTLEISGLWAADDSGTDIRINGISTGQTAAGFVGLTPFAINSGFVAGTNTLEFVLNNASSTNNPTGLRVEGIGATVLYDQRGPTIPRDYDDPGIAGSGPDIGAFELQPPTVNIVSPDQTIFEPQENADGELQPFIAEVEIQLNIPVNVSPGILLSYDVNTSGDAVLGEDFYISQLDLSTTDENLPTNTIFIPQGADRAELSVAVLPDAIDEGLGTIDITLRESDLSDAFLLPPRLGHLLGSDVTTMITIEDSDQYDARLVTLNNFGEQTGEAYVDPDGNATTWVHLASQPDIGNSDWVEIELTYFLSGSEDPMGIVPLEFTAGNWDVPQLVVVPSLVSNNNGFAERVVNLELRVTRSNDPNYAGLERFVDIFDEPDDVLLQVKEGGDTQTVTPTVSIQRASDAIEGNTQPGTFIVSSDLPAPEGGLQVAFRVSAGLGALGTQYTIVDDVSARFRSATIPAGALSTAILIEAIDDLVADESTLVEISLSQSPAYDLDLPTATLRVLDNDFASIETAILADVDSPVQQVATPFDADTLIVTSEDGGEFAFGLRLSSQPTSNVTVTVSSEDETEGLVNATFLFTPSNWNEYRVATVQAVDDTFEDGETEYVIAVNAASNDGTYNSQSAPFSITNEDNDSSVESSVNINNASEIIATIAQVAHVAGESVGPGQFEIKLSEPAPSGGLLINYAVFPETADGSDINLPSLFELTGNRNPLQVSRVEEFDTAEGLRSFSLGDLDNDGDQDVLIAYESSITQYFENVGSSTVPEFRLNNAANPLGGAGSFDLDAELGDVDNDGDLDVIQWTTSGTIRFFENLLVDTGALSFAEGAGTANPFSELTLPSQDLWNLTLVDLDGDGLLELLATSSTANSILYDRASQNGPFAESSNNPLANLATGIIALPEFIDWDDDGDLDIFVGGESSNGDFDGNGIVTGTDFLTWQRAVATQDLASDSNFDGAVNQADLEVWEANVPRPFERPLLRFIENTGSDTEAVFVEKFGFENPAVLEIDQSSEVAINYPAFADINNDGFQDLFVPQFSDGISEIRFFDGGRIQEVVVPAGQSSLIVNIPVVEDRTDEGNETFRVGLISRVSEANDVVVNSAASSSSGSVTLQVTKSLANGLLGIKIAGTTLDSYVLDVGTQLTMSGGAVATVTSRTVVDRFQETLVPVTLISGTSIAVDETDEFAVALGTLSLVADVPDAVLALGDSSSDLLGVESGTELRFSDGSVFVVTSPELLGGGNQLYGDYDANSVVQGSDFLLWQRQVGSEAQALTADGNRDGAVNENDLALWQANYGRGAVADYESDGLINGSDFLRWQRDFGASGQGMPADGNDDGAVDGSDLFLWQLGFGDTVPEVGTGVEGYFVSGFAVSEGASASSGDAGYRTAANLTVTSAYNGSNLGLRINETAFTSFVLQKGLVLDFSGGESATVTEDTLISNSGGTFVPVELIVDVAGEINTINSGETTRTGDFFLGRLDTRISSAQITLQDNDEAGVSVVVSGTTTSESGGSQTIRFSLKTQPTADVQVNVGVQGQEATLSSADQSDEQVVQLIFTPANWNVPQIVTAQGVDDQIDDDDANYTIRTTVVSEDLEYADNVVSIAPAMDIAIPDNNIGMGELAIQDLSIPDLTLPPGTILNFTNGASFVLTSNAVALNNTNPTSVTGEFARADQIQVNRVATVVGSDRTKLVVTRAYSATSETIGLQIDDPSIPVRTFVAGTVLDFFNGVRVTLQSDTTFTNATGTVADVTLELNLLNLGSTAMLDESVINESDRTELLVTTALDLDASSGQGMIGLQIFNPEIASKTLAAGTILDFNNGTRAILDTETTFSNTSETIASFTIDLNVITSLATASYQERLVSDLVLTNTDDDSVGVTLIRTDHAAAFAEGASNNFFSVVLNSQPARDVEITLTPTDANGQPTDNIRLAQEIQGEPLTITFTPENWNIKQSIEVTAVDDERVEFDHTVLVTASVSSTDLDYHDLEGSNQVKIFIEDNDLPTATVKTVAGAIEANTPGYFVISLDTPVPDSAGETGIVVNYSISGTADANGQGSETEDVQPISGTARIAPGESQSPLIAFPIDDFKAEGVDLLVTGSTASTVGLQIDVENFFVNAGSYDSTAGTIDLRYPVNDQTTLLSQGTVLLFNDGTTEGTSATVQSSAIVGNEFIAVEIDADPGDVFGTIHQQIELPTETELELVGGVIVKTVSTDGEPLLLTNKFSTDIDVTLVQGASIPSNGTTKLQGESVIVTLDDPSAGSRYQLGDAQTAGLTIIDNDKPGIRVVSPLAAPTALEGGTNGQLFISLLSQPEADVTITLNDLSDDDVMLSDLQTHRELVAQQAYSSSATSIALRLNDAEVDSLLLPANTTLVFGTTTATVSEDTLIRYDAEINAFTSMNVSLDGAIGGDLTADYSYLELGFANGSDSLTFTSNNWYELQEVSIVGIDDNVVENIVDASRDFHTSAIFFTVTSEDPNYQDFELPNETINIIDRSFDTEQTTTSLMQGFLALQDSINNLELPIVGNFGDVAPSFIDKFLEGVAAEIRAQENLTTDSLADAFNTALEAALNIEPLSFEVTGIASDELSFMLTIEDSLTESISLDSNLGLEALNISIESMGTVDLTVGYSLALAFGINTTDGFFIDTADTVFDVNASLALSDNFAASGSLGFIQLDIDNGTMGTSLDAQFAVTLNDVGAIDDRVTLADIVDARRDPLSFVSYAFTGGAVLDLDVTTSVSGNTSFPTFGFTLFSELPLFNYGNEAEASSDDGGFDLAFNDITLDLGEFVNDLLGPVITTINDVVEPFKPIIDVLNKELEFLEEIGLVDLFDENNDGKATLIEVASSLASGSSTASFTRFANAVLGVIEVADSLSELQTSIDNGQNLSIEFGDYVLSGFKGASSNVDASENVDPATAGSSTMMGSQSNQTMSTGNNRVSNFFGKLGDLGISLDVIENPLNVIKLLLGQDIDLVTWDVPELDLGFSIEKSFPIFPPLGLFGVLEGGFRIQSDLTFGFDTFGLSQWKESDFAIEDAYLVLDGFYLSDIDPDTGEDVDELTLQATIAAGAKINAVVASVTLKGGIEGTAGLDIVDVGEYEGESDGRIRASEIIPRLSTPLELFELAGKVDVFFNLAVAVGLDLGFVALTETVVDVEFARFTLFEFSVGGGGAASAGLSSVVVDGELPTPNALTSASKLGDADQPGSAQELAADTKQVAATSTVATSQSTLSLNSPQFALAAASPGLDLTVQALRSVPQSSAEESPSVALDSAYESAFPATKSPATNTNEGPLTLPVAPLQTTLMQGDRLDDVAGRFFESLDEDELRAHDEAFVLDGCFADSYFAEDPQPQATQVMVNTSLADDAELTESTQTEWLTEELLESVFG